MALKSQDGLLNACLQSWTLTLTLVSYPTISSTSSPPRKYNSFARTRKPICCLIFFARCIFRLTKDLNTKSGQLFCSPYVFVTKPGRQIVTYKLAFKLYITICATCSNLNRKVQCVSFVCLFFLFPLLIQTTGT